MLLMDSGVLTLGEGRRAQEKDGVVIEGDGIG